jgi:Ribbon-helix-helix domain
MKGRQIALTMYLPPRKYWLLKAVSRRTKVSMQFLLRRALDEVLAEGEHAGATDR